MADDDKHDKSDHTCPLPQGDFLVPIAPIPGGTLCLRHMEDHKFAIGPMLDAREGMSVPDGAHVVSEDEHGVLRVGPTVGQLKAGNGKPAQVATADYRESWERTFGKHRVRQA